MIMSFDHAHDSFLVDAQFGSPLPFVCEAWDGYLLDSTYWKWLRKFVQAA
jgi:hypothetical protein